MTTITPLQNQDLHLLAETVADAGVGAVEPALIDRFAAQALARGASPVLVGIVVDPTAPPVVRIRAFGRAATAAARRADLQVAA